MACAAPGGVGVGVAVGEGVPLGVGVGVPVGPGVEEGVGPPATVCVVVPLLEAKTVSEW